MAVNFKKIAQKETTISDIMENRTKAEKKDGRIHICDFDLVPSKDGECYAVCAINEDEFINGGHILTRIFTAIVEEYEGDIDAARHDFREGGGLDVKLARKKTRSNRDITTVEVL